MTAMFLVIAVAGLLLAFANGANDNAKGVATLIGGGSLSTRAAVIYAAIATFLGSVAAVVLAGTLLARFGGKGIVDEALIANPAFPASVGIGAMTTVLIATFIGIPISTTHSIVGALVGIGLAAGGLHGGEAAGKFFVPLLVSPFIATAAAFLLYILFRSARRGLGVTSGTCLCVGKKVSPVAVDCDGRVCHAATGLELTTDEVEQCRNRYQGRVVGIEAQRVLDVCHLFTAGSVSFARGLNDTPKIAALLLAAGAVWKGDDAPLSKEAALVAVGIGIAIGGLVAVRKVARTMSRRITEMNDGQGFTANLVTAALVIVASRFGVPVSTTHVSCGSLFGIGAASRRGHWRMIGAIVLAWVATLPLAAAIGAGSWLVLSK
jgi:PiT family inorganic phosphate transporter